MWIFLIYIGPIIFKFLKEKPSKRQYNLDDELMKYMTIISGDIFRFLWIISKALIYYLPPLILKAPSFFA